MKMTLSEYATKYKALIGVVIAVALIFLSPTVLSVYNLGLLSKYLCYAMVAVGIGLAWGQGGMLTLPRPVLWSRRVRDGYPHEA